MKYLLIILLGICFEGTAQVSGNKPARYVKVKSGYLVVLRQGDSVFQELEKIAKLENIPSANFTGMGFLSHVRFGFFNQETKDFDPKDFYEVELASLTGSFAWEGNTASLHLHGVAGDKNMNTYGGHLLLGVVGTGSLEILINVHDQRMERITDEKIGAKVLEIK